MIRCLELENLDIRRLAEIASFEGCADCNGSFECRTEIRAFGDGDPTTAAGSRPEFVNLLLCPWHPAP